MRYGDLPVKVSGEFLWCGKCGERYSATRGDYFAYAPDDTPKCHGWVLRLMRERTILEPVDWAREAQS